MKKYCMDADIFIGSWNDKYKPSIFPTLWGELFNAKNSFSIIKPIYDEIDPISATDIKKLTPEELKEKHPLRSWLQQLQLTPKSIAQKIDHYSLLLEEKYETKPQGKGAGENDIKLIAYAKHHNGCVVTSEAKQNLQQSMPTCNYKIPLICELEHVQCINFIEMLEELKIKI